MTKITVFDVLDGDRLEESWRLYHSAFEHLNTLTVQRHLLRRDEFDDIAADHRIEKWLVVGDDGQLLGLATYTNILDAWPLISPEYFQRRWPEQYALSRIWYCGFVAVQPHAPNTTFLQLITDMYKVAEDADGVIGLDICRYNDETYRLGRRVIAGLTRISGGNVDAEVADAQQFYLFRAHNPAVAGAAIRMADAPPAPLVEMSEEVSR